MSRIMPKDRINSTKAMRNNPLLHTEPNMVLPISTTILLVRVEVGENNEVATNGVLPISICTAMLYAAVPVYDGQDHLRGIIRTASSTLPIDSAYSHTRASILTALALTILFAIIAAILLARRQLLPIRQMTLDAQRIGQGELSHRLAIHTGDELEFLAHTINQLTASLSQKIHDSQPDLLVFC